MFDTRHSEGRAARQPTGFAAWLAQLPGDGVAQAVRVDGFVVHASRLEATISLAAPLGVAPHDEASFRALMRRALAMAEPQGPVLSLDGDALLLRATVADEDALARYLDAVADWRGALLPPASGGAEAGSSWPRGGR